VALLDQKMSHEGEVSNLWVPVGICKTLILLPRSALTHGKFLIWNCGCMICGFFLAGNLCIPVDHLYLWCTLATAQELLDDPLMHSLPD